MKGTLLKVVTLFVLGTRIDDVYYQHGGARRQEPDSTGIRARAGAPEHGGPQSRPGGIGELHRERTGRVQRLPYEPAICRGRRPVCRPDRGDQRGWLPWRRNGVPSVSLRLTESHAACIERPARGPDARTIPRGHAQGDGLQEWSPADLSLLQIMPWPVYGKMSDRELQAMYEYLRAIPCVGSAERCGR